MAIANNEWARLTADCEHSTDSKVVTAGQNAYAQATPGMQRTLLIDPVSGVHVDGAGSRTAANAALNVAKGNYKP